MIDGSIETEAAYPARPAAVFTLSVLMLAAIMSYVDRQTLSLLVGPIRRDLGISDTQFSLLQGFSFSVFFVFVGLPFGWLVDRSNRRNIVVIGIVVWGTMTILSGFTTSFLQLAITRMGLGAGEAALIPAAYSLLADYFPPRQHGRAISFFHAATFAGTGIGFLLGGLVIRVFHDQPIVTLPLIGLLPLWKAAFICVGIPALLVAVPMAFVREVPRRGIGAPQDAAGRAAAPRIGMIAYTLRHAGTIACVIGAYVVAAFMWYAWSPWFPTYLVRTFGLARSSSGLLAGTIVAITGVAGSLTGGVLGDRWTAAGVPGAKFRLTLVLWFGAMPAALGLLLFENLYVSCVSWGLFAFVMTMTVGSVGPTLQDMVPNYLRGQIVVFNYLMTGLIAQGLAPFTVAVVTDHVFHDDRALRYSLALVPLPAVVLGLVLTFAGMRRYDRLRAELRAGRLSEAPAGAGRSRLEPAPHR